VNITGINTHNGTLYHYTCNKVIVSYPQTLLSMATFDLDAQEFAVFANVENYNFWCGDVYVSGNITNQAFQLTVANFSSPFFEALYPGIVFLQKEYPDLRPAQFLAYSKTWLPINQITTLVTTQLRKFAAYGLIDSNFTIATVEYHLYIPHGRNASMAQSPNFYTKLKNLQGHRNTYYVGGLPSYQLSYVVWEHSYNLIQENFPPKH